MRLLAVIITVASMSSHTRADGPSAGPRADRHLFILSGQSNMHHLDTKVSFTPAVEKAFGKDKVTVVKSAKTGAPIRAWDQDYKWPGDRPIPRGRKRPGKEQKDQEEFEAEFGGLYVKLMAAVKTHTAGKTYETVTLVWMQGETDAGQKLSDLYVDSFNRILARLKGDLGIESLNLVIGRLSDCGIENPEWVKMRELQVKYAEGNPDCEWVNTDDLNDVIKNRETKNNLHYTEEGYGILGERFAEKAIALIKKKEKPTP